MNKHPSSEHSGESGNIIVFIFIGVALLAALFFAFSKSTGTSTSAMTQQKAKILASELLSYAQQIENGVNRVRSRGCSESQISFEQGIISGYSNTSAPSNSSCHIFEEDGGRITFDNKPSSLTISDSEIYHFSGTNIVQDIESTAPEIILFVNNINSDICNEINKNFNISELISNIPTDTEIEDAVKFTGAFASTRTIGDEDAALEGQVTACFQDTTNGNYVFYHVLLAR